MTRAYAHLITILTVVSMRFEDRKDRGATAVEYGLLVGVIAIALIAGISLLGPRLTAVFQQVTGLL